MLNVLMITPEVDKNHDSRGFIHQWVNYLASKVTSLNVITIKTGELQLPRNVNVYSINHKKSKVVSCVKFYSILYNIFRCKQIDVVFVHMTPIFVILVAPICWVTHKPIILWHTHGHVSNISELAHFFVRKVVTAGKEGFGAKDSKKIIIIGHGIDTNFFIPRDPLTRDRFEITTVCRISPSKNLEIVIKALPKVIERFGKNKIHYTIIGGPFANTPRDEKYFTYLQTLVKDLHLENEITFEGPIPYKKISIYYQSCDIFINPSLTGSLDKTGLEAMACGKPVLSCNKAYLPIFGDYEKYLFFEPSDHVKLSSLLIELINKSPDELKKIGTDLRNMIVSNHNLDQLMNRLISIFTHEIKPRIF